MVGLFAGVPTNCKESIQDAVEMELDFVHRL